MAEQDDNPAAIDSKIALLNFIRRRVRQAGRAARPHQIAEEIYDTLALTDDLKRRLAIDALAKIATEFLEAPRADHG